MRLAVAVLLASTVAHADPVISGGVGAGFVGGQPASALELRGDLAWDSGAVGLGARVRAIGDHLEPWTATDWLAVLRYFEIANAAARDAAQAYPTEGVRLAAAAGALGNLRLGDATVIDGFTTAALTRRATGVDLRAGDGDASAELAVADVLRDTLIAATATAPAGPVQLGATFATGTAPTTFEASAGLARRGYRRTGAITAAAGAQAHGLGAALIGDAAARTGPAILRARAELDAASTSYTVAPFGPLTLATPMAMRTRGRFGAAGALTLDTEAVQATVAARKRPGFPLELDARVAMPATRHVQAAAAVARTRQALVVGAEARAELFAGLWSDLELARQYDDTGAPLWQATAWFGWTSD